MIQELHQAQDKIAKSQKRFRVVNCGRRFGKTTLAVLEMIGKAVFNNNLNIAYIAPTYQQARDIAWQDLKKICQPVAKNINESRLEITLKTNKGGTSIISLRGWESIETLRGQKFDFLVIDEVASMKNFWTNWHEVLRPTLTDTRGEVLFISTPKGFNHFYDLYNEEQEDKDYQSFHFTSYDNPYLPVDELEKAKQELTEDRFAQEYLADFRKTEGLVYKEFNRKKHLFDPQDKKQEFEAIIKDTIAGIDFGFTNPTAIIIIKIDISGNYWITDEMYKTGMTDNEVAEYVSSLKLNRVYPDPESPSAIKELRLKGVNVRNVVKNKDSIKNGIDKIRELLKADKLKISKHCNNTIWEFETYCYPDNKDGLNEKEIPVKANDHSMDAIRYAIYTTEGRQTEAKQYIPNLLSPIQRNRPKQFIPKLRRYA